VAIPHPKELRYCDDVLPAQRRRCFLIREISIRKDFFQRTKNKIPEFAYVPFGAGARHCIGRWFGEMEVKTMVCHILRNFSLHSLDSRDKMLTVMNITLQSTVPFRIRFSIEAQQQTASDNAWIKTNFVIYL
ncbi:hypothetical protein CEXT_106201, partial [Caerostris extrusa]